MIGYLVVEVLPALRQAQRIGSVGRGAGAVVVDDRRPRPFHPAVLLPRRPRVGLGDAGRQAVEQAVDGRRLVVYEGGRGGGRRRERGILYGEEDGAQGRFGQRPPGLSQVRVLAVGGRPLTLVARAERVLVGHRLPVPVLRIVRARGAEVRLDGGDLLGTRPVLVNLLLAQPLVVALRGGGGHGRGRLGVPVVLVHDPLVLGRPLPHQAGARRGERFRQRYHGYLRHGAVVVPHVPHVEALPAHNHPQVPQPAAAVPPQQGTTVPVIPRLVLPAPLLAPDPGILRARPLLRARRPLRRGRHLPALVRGGLRDLRVRVRHPHGVLGQRQVARVKRVSAHGLRYTGRHRSPIPVHEAPPVERDRVVHRGRSLQLETRLAAPVRGLLRETAFLLPALLVVVARRVAAAHVAHLVREPRCLGLLLPVPEPIRPHRDPARLLLGGGEAGRGAAGTRAILKRQRRVSAAVFLVAPPALLGPGRFRSLVERAARLVAAAYRHRDPGGRPSPETERHGRAARVRPAALRRPLVLVL